MIKIVHNRILNGWYVVRVTGMARLLAHWPDPYQTPLAGQFKSRAAALRYLNREKKCIKK